MRTALVSAFLLFANVLLSPQSRPADANENNLYWIALRTSILQMEKDYEQMDDSLAGERIRTDYRHIIVEKNPFITKELPTEFESHIIEYLDTQALGERYRRLGKPYAALVIQPLQNEGITLKIAVVVNWISYKKSRVQLALSDWSNVEFQYDCEKRRFIVSSVKLGGI